MRTTITLDDDVSALIARERERTGESFRTVVNRLLRRGAGHTAIGARPPLPKHPGAPIVDISDVSAVLAAIDDERRAKRRLP